TKNHYGLSIDIGTTTVVVYLVDMDSGKIIDYTAGYNGQVKLGQDILTRIYLAATPDGAEELKKAVLGTLNQLIERIGNRNNIPAGEISAATIGANSTMIHLLLGLDPSRIAVTPYIPVVNNPGLFKAAEVGLEINPLAVVYLMPAAGSYVGGDIVAGVLASGMHRSAELTLFVDIGTNVEVVLGNKDWLVACAGAAGPALEGGVAQSGMQAQSGAIESVRIDPLTGQVHYTTIGNTPAKGLCGSGLIDCLAELFLDGIIDRAGHFQNSQKEYILVPADKSAEGKDILVTQNDINNLMRTKGAVNAALDLLLESVGLDLSVIERFYASGAFGHYLNLESAVTIGIYPDLPREKMVRIGNTSGEGARMALVSNQKRREAEGIVGKMTYFELIASQEFMISLQKVRFA
ncbi:MAG TPA: ASKHA domain-containing protein, partial [Spirochaetia bacterium]|nr:ASKHA domain-containing protein [Spirochaetia bacterium]